MNQSSLVEKKFLICMQHSSMMSHLSTSFYQINNSNAQIRPYKSAHEMTFCTFDQLHVLRMRPVECLFLLLQEEMCLVQGQAAEVSPCRQIEPHLSGRAQTSLSKSQKFTVSTLLAVCKAAHMGLDNKLQIVFEPFNHSPTSHMVWCI